MILFFWAVLVSLLFFIVFPAVFSLLSLIEYRKIRRIVVRSAAADFLSVDSKTGEFCRVFGKFDGFKDDNEIWIRSETLLIRARLKDGKIISLPEKVNKNKRGLWGNRIPGSLKIIKWKKLNTLASGIQIFLCGTVKKSGGVFVFDTCEKNTLVVFFEGEANGVDRELVVQAKNRYSYFQSPSISSLVAGSLLLALISVFEYRFYGFSFMFFFYLLTAAAPILFFVPPGCFFMILSYNLKYAVFKLRHDYYFHYFNSGGVKSDPRRYHRKLRILETVAVEASVAAALVNFLVFLALIYFFAL